MQKRKAFLLVFFLAISCALSWSQSARTAKKNGSFEFINQNIRDILFSLSTYTGTPIVADDTVSGTAVFQFAGGDFDKAFETFLAVNRLYVEKTTEVWTVSRILMTIDADGYLTIDALDVSPYQLIEKIAMKTKTTIVQDVLPSLKTSLHIERLSLFDTIEIIMKPYSDYTVVKTEKYVQVKKNPSQIMNAPNIVSGSVKIRETSGLYDVACERAKLSDVLSNLFSVAKKEYSSFARGDQVIERLSFSGKRFEDTLAMLLEQANSEAVPVDNVWYILPVAQSDILKKVKEDGKIWDRFDLKYLSGKECVAFIHARFPGTGSIILPDGTSILLYIDESQKDSFQNYIRTMDATTKSIPIRLKYIKTEDFFKSLPPSVKREDLVDAGNGNTVFFIGGDDKRSQLLKDLEVIDRPRTRIRYDLLIIQSQDSSELSWGFNADASQMEPGDMSMITGSLGNLLSLNFDVITVFGYQFAAKMNVALAENQADVFADTTLYGLSGQEIKFQNTNTYRYRDYYIDSKTGDTVYTGVTREITSGLVLSVNGWVSGDGMITSSVTVSVSKRGTDVSTKVGNPPPTSEKVVTTQVRSRSGETIVLSGLRQNDSTVIEERTPFISKVPILGYLFRKTNKTKENSQMIIYLVPHVDLGTDEYTDEGLRTASVYNKYVVPFLGVSQ